MDPELVLNDDLDTMKVVLNELGMHEQSQTYMGQELQHMQPLPEAEAGETPFGGSEGGVQANQSPGPREENGDWRSEGAKESLSRGREVEGAHGVSEKMRRDRINSRIEELRKILPHRTGMKKLSKSAVLDSALKEMKELQKSIACARSENSRLQHNLLQGEKSKGRLGLSAEALDPLDEEEEQGAHCPSAVGEVEVERLPKGGCRILVSANRRPDLLTRLVLFVEELGMQLVHASMHDVHGGSAMGVILHVREPNGELVSPRRMQQEIRKALPDT